MFVEILLPLPLYSTFTYSVPDDMQFMEVGSRVLVQFGRKKFYTGIVVNIHNREPKGYDVKPILAVFDSKPIVRYPQLKFWNWIAEYYLCSPGEVYKAAVPSGLKPESETYISLNPDYEPCEDEAYHATDREKLVISFFEEKKKMRISELKEVSGIKNVSLVVKSLLEHDILRIDEHLIEKYRPKKMSFVELTIDRDDNDSLHEFFTKASRSRQQEKALITYLDLSGWIHRAEEIKEVEKERLLVTAGVSPAVLKSLRDKGIFRVVKKNVSRFKNDENKNGEITLSPLSKLQADAFRKIEAGFKTFEIQLLHGVTGSGKTEIYAHLAKNVLSQGNQVLFLVPEISLTTQLSDRLRKIFGNRLLIYHSKFSDTERVEIWNKLLNSHEPVIVLGVRSSIFLPFHHLGLVIVDEEHESSFKQYDPAPRYNARDAAMMLARMHGAKTLLGSATPSIETFYKALNQKYGLVSLLERFEGATLPDVELIDMKEMKRKKEVNGVLSSYLRKRITKTMEEGKQAIMFQNRRGFAPFVICDQCGWTPKCRNCDVSLVYHKRSELLRCHYCGFSTTLPKLCPACGQNSIKTFGYGTERIADQLHEDFEGYRVSRMDLDTTRNKEAYQEIIEEFAHHETDILVGTQMVSKGLDFNDVLTVGVLNADTLLNFPDFKSNERAFNMLEQVAGRAGRRKEKGAVIIQTFNPKHEVLNFIKNHDYNGYYQHEIAEREKYFYPPFCKIINIYIKNKDREKCDSAAVKFTLELRKVFGGRVLGPEKPFISKIANFHIQSIMLKIESGASMKKVKDILRQLFATIAHFPEIKSSIIYYDVDPA